MKGRLFVFIFSFIVIFTLTGCIKNNEDGKEIKDMVGRTVQIPEDVTKVFATLPSGTMFVYSIDPDLLIGYNYEFNEQELDFILEDYRDLTAFGQGGKINKEAIITANPDIIIMYGELIDSEIEVADSLEEDTGIPVVMLDGSLEKSPDAYRFIGEKVFDMKERTEVLASYAEEALLFAEETKADNDGKVSLYYGNGPESLETTPIGSPHAEIFTLVGAVNVADVNLNAKGRVLVSPEQLITWNPEVILINGEPKGDDKISPTNAVEEFRNDERYMTIDAVKNDKVYAIPNYPYTWIDRPISTNRLIGIYWLASILYAGSVDIEEEAKNYYELFYHWNLTD